MFLLVKNQADKIPIKYARAYHRKSNGPTENAIGEMLGKSMYIEKYPLMKISQWVKFILIKKYNPHKK